MSVSAIRCDGNLLLKYSPGLTNVPRVVTITVYPSLDVCVSPTHEEITSGEIESTQVTGRRSCNDLFIPAFGRTHSITWSDETTSTAVYDSTTTYLLGNLLVAQVGQVTSGTFAGSAMTADMILPVELGACKTPQGIKTLTGPMSFNIASPK